MATHSIILAWETLWTEEPRGLESIGSQRVGQTQMSNWAHDQKIYWLHKLLNNTYFVCYVYILYSHDISFLNFGISRLWCSSVSFLFLYYHKFRPKFPIHTFKWFQNVLKSYMKTRNYKSLRRTHRQNTLSHKSQ